MVALDRFYAVHTPKSRVHMKIYKEDHWSLTCRWDPICKNYEAEVVHIHRWHQDLSHSSKPASSDFSLRLRVGFMSTFKSKAQDFMSVFIDVGRADDYVARTGITMYKVGYHESSPSLRWKTGIHWYKAQSQEGAPNSIRALCRGIHG